MYFYYYLWIYIALVYYVTQLAIQDHQFRKLPKKYVYGFYFVANVLNVLTNIGHPMQIVFSLFVGFLFFIIMLLSYLKGWVGGGDFRYYPMIVATLNVNGFFYFSVLLLISTLTVGLYYRYSTKERKVPFGVIAFIPCLLSYASMLLH